MKGNPQELKLIADHLRSLGECPPTPELRKEVEGYLFNKWEGLQSVAAQVLGAWGGPESARALQGLLLRTYEREAAWSIRGVAVWALAESVDERDVEWVLDLFFSIKGVVPKHELVPLVAALPVPAARQRVEGEARSADRDNRQAAMAAITRMPFPDKVELLERMAGDPDSDIRRVVKIWLDHLAQDNTDWQSTRSS
jgi:HEAT repeat protein